METAMHVIAAHGTIGRLIRPVALLVGFGAGSLLALPVATLAMSWINDYMIPAFIQLYASGIPFCG